MFRWKVLPKSVKVQTGQIAVDFQLSLLVYEVEAAVTNKHAGLYVERSGKKGNDAEEERGNRIKRERSTKPALRRKGLRRAPFQHRKI